MPVCRDHQIQLRMLLGGKRGLANGRGRQGRHGADQILHRRVGQGVPICCLQRRDMVGVAGEPVGHGDAVGGANDRDLEIIGYLLEPQLVGGHAATEQNLVAIGSMSGIYDDVAAAATAEQVSVCTGSSGQGVIAAQPIKGIRLGPTGETVIARRRGQNQRRGTRSGRIGQAVPGPQAGRREEIAPPTGIQPEIGGIGETQVIAVGAKTGHLRLFRHPGAPGLLAESGSG